jgi:excisionase family DNA binding protein
LGVAPQLRPNEARSAVVVGGAHKRRIGLRSSDGTVVIHGLGSVLGKRLFDASAAGTLLSSSGELRVAGRSLADAADRVRSAKDLGVEVVHRSKDRVDVGPASTATLGFEGPAVRYRSMATRVMHQRGAQPLPRPGSAPASTACHPTPFSTGDPVPAAHLSYEDKTVLTTTKEHIMGTTVDNTAEGGILTIDQAAAYLSVPKATLYTWRTRRAGFGPRAVKLGGCLRYRRSDLDAWIADHLESFDDTPAMLEQRAGDGVSLSRASRPR